MTVAESILNRAGHPLLLRAIDSVFFLVEYAVLFYLFSCIFPAQQTQTRPLWRGAAYVLAGGVLQTLTAYFSGNNMYVYLTVIFVVMLAYSLPRRGDLLSKITWSVFSLSLVLFAEEAVIDVFIYVFTRLGRDVAPIFVSAVYFSLTKLFAKLLLLLMVYLIRRITTQTQFELPYLFRLSFFIISILFVALNFLMSLTGGGWGTQSIPFLHLYTALAILSIILIVYNLYSSFAREYDRNLGQSLVRQQLQYQKQHAEEVSELYNDMQMLRHDLKNHIACMEALLKTGDYDELRHYFRQLQDATADYGKWVETGHPVTNAVINLKLQEACSKGVEMRVEAAIPSDISINATDLSAILSNLLDNAIEASTQAASPAVDLAVVPHKNYLSIQVANSTQGNVLTHNPNLETTKLDDARQHGLGRSIIKSIVEKYDGAEQLRVDDGRFVYTAQLKNAAGTGLAPCRPSQKPASSL